MALSSSSNATGTAPVRGTFFGASSHERITDIALTQGGNVYATGWTKSQNLPTTTAAYDSSYNHGEGDAFVAKLSADGRALLYATFLGSWGTDRAEGIAVDEGGAAYVTGWTDSVAFPPARAPTMARRAPASTPSSPSSTPPAAP